MPRIDQTMSGQDFAIGVNAATASTQHNLNRANGTSLEPRVVRMLGRLSLLDTSNGAGRGLVTSLAVSGWPLLVTPGPGTTTNAAAATRPGFPLRACDPRAMVDRSNTILCACGPNSPLELGVSWNTAMPLRGLIGTDLPDIALLPEILSSLSEGDLYGEPNWALGGGEVTQANANTAETITVRYKSPRGMRLERLIVDLFRSNGGAVLPGDVLLTSMSLAGTPLLSTSAAIDALTLSPFCTDEDGLQINEQVGADTEIELQFTVVAAGAGVSFNIQHGFFTS